MKNRSLFKPNKTFLLIGIRLFADEDDDDDLWGLGTGMSSNIDLQETATNVNMEEGITTFDENVSYETVTPVPSDDSQSDTEAENEMFRKLQENADREL